MISTEHVIDFDNLVLTSKQVFDEWEYLIVEHDGHYSEEDQYLIFGFKGIEVCIGFELTIKGWHWYRPSSYMEPEDGETHITDVDIDVNYLLVADEEVVVDKDLKKTLTEVVKKYVKYE
jgi:hypothetical protein